ncbi:histone-like nucleoid-structuring protein Lsr2 [Dietzia cinnamea]|uniref:histone-like nucleoid-structuring protein Lsr2 n=1 Tax=Dietzia cinnamea TaxID=321318 RepID=UPI00223B5177|nr:Lsr2 family protein [Dietzia cinnamea]MCT2076068.1 Lsr2 family protein [Dietzia cinnamea]MCT2219791.1 Lsr2 family protein [Dietzia cinnamea]
MAVKYQMIRISDLSGEELGEGGETIEFSIGSDSYQIDLSDDEAAEFHEAFRQYVDVATKTKGRGVRKSGKQSSGTGMSKEELQAIRDWANNNGYEVSSRGRIKQEIVDAYRAAN